MKDFIIILVVAAILGLACFYIIRSKKKGAKCVGCPFSGNCNSCKGNKK